MLGQASSDSHFFLPSESIFFTSIKLKLKGMHAIKKKCSIIYRIKPGQFRLQENNPVGDAVRQLVNFLLQQKI